MKNEIFPEIIRDIFTKIINNHYNPRHINHFESPFIMEQSVSYLGPKIWDIASE